MDKSKFLKKSFERNATALKIMPFLGQRKGKVKIISAEGLACEVESGQWKFRVDMIKQAGGMGTGPDPEIYGAGALGSCLSIMTRMWAAKLEVPIYNVEVEVEFDTDARFLYGVGDVPARWKSVRYHVSVESPAPDSEVMKVLDKAHQQSHVRGDYEHAHTIERRVTINKPATGIDCGSEK